MGVLRIYLMYVYWDCTCENNTHRLCEVMDLQTLSLVSLSPLHSLYTEFISKQLELNFNLNLI